MSSIQVVAAVLERGGQILIAQRRRDGRHPFKWEFPGGKVEPGEKLRAALQRELKEELGIDAEIGEEMDSFEVRYGQGPAIHLRFYRVTKFEGEPRNLDFERIAWEHPARLPDYDFLEGDITFIRKLALNELK